jgi:nicotinamide phosphoribosyltransferase
LVDGATEVLRTVYQDGRLLVDDSFAAIRARAAER